MRRHPIVSALVALTVGGPVLASDINYSYLQVDLLGARACADDDYDDCIGKDLNPGFALHGSAGIGRHLLAVLDFSSPDYDGYRLTSTSLGFGVHLPMARHVDFLAIASYERIRQKVSYDGGSFSESWDGLGITAGVRGDLPYNTEWNTSLKYREIDDIDSILSIALGVRHHFTPSFAVGLDITENRYDALNEALISVGFRFDFGTGG